MVVGRLGRLADAVGVGQRGGEVGELVALTKRSVTHFPAIQGGEGGLEFGWAEHGHGPNCSRVLAAGVCLGG